MGEETNAPTPDDVAERAEEMAERSKTLWLARRDPNHKHWDQFRASQPKT